MYISLPLLSLLAVTFVSAAPFDGEVFLNKRDGSAPIKVDKKVVEEFKYWSEWAAASYCPVQTAKTSTGAKVTCGTYAICPMVETRNTKIVTTWADVGAEKGAMGASGATGFVGVDNDKKMIVVSQRGSVSVQNWVTDVKFALQDCKEFGAGARCEVGFYSFWQDSKPAALQGVKKALAENPDYNIVVTGHSLGASAAVFAAGDLRLLYPNKSVYLYSYGQPRAGNEALSKFITDQGKNFRITHTSDIVPRMPWETAVNILNDKDIYAHISPEYWITDGLGNNPDNYKILEGMKNYEGNAGNSWGKFNIIAHIQYYQVNMYGCTLSFLPMGMASSIGIGYPAGSRKWSENSTSSQIDYDVETTPAQLAELGVEGPFAQEWTVRQLPGTYPVPI